MTETRAARATDLGLVPGEKGEGSRKKGEPGQGGTDRCRDPSCTGHGRGQAGRDGRKKQGEAGQGDSGTERPELRGPRTRAWSLGGRRKETDRDPGTARHTEAGMVRLVRMRTRARSPVRREKEGEGRTNQGPRDSWKPGWVPRWRTPTPGSPGRKGGRERDLDTETERQREALSLHSYRYNLERRTWT